MEDIQGKIASVEASVKAGNFAEVEQQCRDLLKQELQIEEKARVVLLLSKALSQSGAAKAALPVAEEAVEFAEASRNKELKANALTSAGAICVSLKDYARSIEYFHQALTAYQDIDNKTGIVVTLKNLGIANAYLSNIETSLEYHQRALSLSKELNLKTEVLINTAGIARQYFLGAKYPQALEYYHQAIDLAEELGDTRRAALYRDDAGVAYYSIGEYDNALKNCRKALVLLEELNDMSDIAKAMGSIALIYNGLNNYERAIEYWESALSKYRELESEYNIAQNLGNIGTALAALKQNEEALQCFSEALKIYEEAGYEPGMATNLTNIGSLHLEMSEYESAVQYFQKALHIYKKNNNKGRVAVIFGNLGRVYGAKTYREYAPTTAESYLIEAITIAEELNIKRFLYEAYKHLTELYAQEGRWQDSHTYLKKYYETEKEVQSEEAKKVADKFAFERQIAVMEKEKEVTDMLLHKFLPSPIVNEIKAKEGKIVVEKYQSISVLFADIVGFTKLSLQISPELMIEMLNAIFTKFDKAIKEVGGHRLRTIGDGYFAVCGAPDRVEQHQYKLAQAAFKLGESIILPESIEKHLPPHTKIGIRIGLHCGEAVCGMVGGLEKLQYDVYGDTVNTASRMESHGEPSKIHISEDFKNTLAEYPEFTFIPREPMTIKGKGIMQTYFLEQK